MSDRFTSKWIVKPVHKFVINRTRYNYNHYRMDLADSFQEAVRACPNLDGELAQAFWHNDFRNFIPSAYLSEYLDFGKYPLYQTT